MLDTGCWIIDDRCGVVVSSQLVDFWKEEKVPAPGLVYFVTNFLKCTALGDSGESSVAIDSFYCCEDLVMTTQFGLESILLCRTGLEPVFFSRLI